MEDGLWPLVSKQHGQLLVSVLILVLMEDDLWQIFKIMKYNFSYVLILVLMEDDLWHRQYF